MSIVIHTIIVVTWSVTIVIIAAAAICDDCSFIFIIRDVVGVAKVLGTVRHHA